MGKEEKYVYDPNRPPPKPKDPNNPYDFIKQPPLVPWPDPRIGEHGPNGLKWAGKEFGPYSEFEPPIPAKYRKTYADRAENDRLNADDRWRKYRQEEEARQDKGPWADLPPQEQRLRHKIAICEFLDYMDRIYFYYYKMHKDARLRKGLNWPPEAHRAPKDPEWRGYKVPLQGEPGSAYFEDGSYYIGMEVEWLKLKEEKKRKNGGKLKSSVFPHPENKRRFDTTLYEFDDIEGAFDEHKERKMERKQMKREKESMKFNDDWTQEDEARYVEQKKHFQELHQEKRYRQGKDSGDGDGERTRDGSKYRNYTKRELKEAWTEARDVLFEMGEERRVALTGDDPKSFSSKSRDPDEYHIVSSSNSNHDGHSRASYSSSSGRRRSGHDIGNHDFHSRSSHRGSDIGSDTGYSSSRTSSSRRASSSYSRRDSTKGYISNGHHSSSSRSNRDSHKYSSRDGDSDTESFSSSGTVTKSEYRHSSHRSRQRDHV